jgi:glycosyltransferase involved in cell wall biosynthesis
VKKVFHVITKLELGGAQEVTLMTLERLPRERYALGLVTGPEGLLVDRANQIEGLSRFWIPSLVREVRPLKDLISFVTLLRLFKRERPDVVHTHSSKAGIVGRWAARAAGVPIIFHTVHGFSFHDYQPMPVRLIYVWLERLTTRITTKTVVVSYANAEKGEKAGVFTRKDWVLCRDAIPVDRFLAAGARRTKLSVWGVDPAKTVVGMVACLKPQKSPVDFIDVAATVLRKRTDVHFVMAGDGELRPEVEDRIREHGIDKHVTLLGWQDDMPEIYRNLDIVVLTSLWEGLPCVFSEAMASELPIVATNVDGAREAIVHGETGYLHQPHDIEGMAASVLELVKNPRLRIAMGANGRLRVSEFDIGTSVKRLEQAYTECFST